MNKLTAGIFAGILTIVTVNAARADIATTNYVNQNVDAKVGALSGLETTAKTSAVAAINEVKDSVDTVAGNIVSKVSDMTEGNKNSETLYPSMAVAQQIAKEATGQDISDLKSNVESLLKDLNDLEQKVEDNKGETDDVISGLTGTGTGTTTGNGMVKMVTQENGVVTATRGLVAKTDLDTALTTEINGKMATSAYDTATTMAADGTYAKKANTVGVNLTELDKGVIAAKAAADAAATDAANALTDAKAYTDTRETAITTAYTGAINTAKSEIKTTTDGLNTRVTANTNAITTLNGADTVEGSVKQQIKAAIAGVNSAAGELAERVEANETAITDITKTNGTIDTKIAAAKSEIETTTDALDGRVTANETAITNLTNNKANAADVYTKTEIDGKVNTINTSINGKVTATNLQNKLLTTTAAGQLQDASTGLTKPSDCGTNGITCMLVNDGTGFKWEKIVDTYSAN